MTKRERETVAIPDIPEHWQQLAVDNLYLYAIFAISLEGNLLTWNPGVKVVFGFEADEFIGQHASMFFTPEDIKAGISDLEFRRAREQGNANDVRWHVRKDGSQFWATGAMTALRNDEGTLTGYAKVVRDSSKAKVLEDNLEQLNSNLEREVANRTADLRQLVAQLTLIEQKERSRLAQTLHDSVQQELYALQFSLAKLKGQLANDAALETIEETEQLLRKTMALTRNVTTDLGPTLLDDADLATTLNWLADAMYTRHGLRVKVVLNQLLEVENEVIHVLLLTLTRELLFNIIKHAGVKEAILTLDATNQALTLSIVDEGTGFVYKMDAVPTGTGLGLSGAQRRLDLFGGSLSVVASPGKGTRITMSLPLTALTLSQ